tara:strand:+ start:575 stop:715 length:141 start_codon:yes stop_codon:yes gene_type:complete
MEVKISGGFFCTLKICSITIDTPNAIINGKNQKSKKLAKKKINSFI